jgi:hypothetical protein
MNVRLESGTVLQREADEAGALAADALAVDVLGADTLGAVAVPGLGLGEGEPVKPVASAPGGTTAQRMRKASAARVRAMDKWYGWNRDWRTVRLPQRP